MTEISSDSQHTTICSKTLPNGKNCSNIAKFNSFCDHHDPEKEKKRGFCLTCNDPTINKKYRYCEDCRSSPRQRKYCRIPKKNGKKCTYRPLDEYDGCCESHRRYYFKEQLEKEGKKVCSNFNLRYCYSEAIDGYAKCPKCRGYSNKYTRMLRGLDPIEKDSPPNQVGGSQKIESSSEINIPDLETPKDISNIELNTDTKRLSKISIKNIDKLTKISLNKNIDQLDQEMSSDSSEKEEKENDIEEDEILYDENLFTSRKTDEHKKALNREHQANYRKNYIDNYGHKAYRQTQNQYFPKQKLSDRYDLNLLLKKKFTKKTLIESTPKIATMIRNQEQLSLDEIAERLKIPKSSVETILKGTSKRNK